MPINSRNEVSEHARDMASQYLSGRACTKMKKERARRFSKRPISDDFSASMSVAGTLLYRRNLKLKAKLERIHHICSFKR